MGKILDFKTKYTNKIFAIDPAFSKTGNCGWAIINLDAEIFEGIKNKPFIHKCGTLQPFSSESSLKTMNDLCKKLVEIWKKNEGYIREPTAIIVERPINYPGSPVRFASIGKLNIFVGMLLKSLFPRMQISPSPNEWKGNSKKENTEKEILDLLTHNDKITLKRDINLTKLFQRHNIFDAIGLGIYGARVLTKKISPPDMIYFNDESRFYDTISTSV